MDTPLVFLDLDGVLNGHDFDPVAMSNPIHRDKVRVLNRILRETGARIVLATAWRYIIHRGEANLAGFDWLLRSHGLMVEMTDDSTIRSKLVGITPPDTMMPASFDGSDFGAWPVDDERGDQIARWRAEHGHTGPYVVIDDGGIRRTDGSWTDLGIAAAGHPFVRTRSDVGLTDADADRAIELLRGARRPMPIPDVAAVAEIRTELVPGG